MRITLSLDTCTGLGSAILFADDKEVAAVEDLRGAGGQASPVYEISKILHSAGVELGDVNEFIVTRGPGSFTGVRTGLSLLRGFLRARNETDFSTCTVFEALTMIAPEASIECATAIFAGRNEAAVQKFARDGKDIFSAIAAHKLTARNCLGQGAYPVILESRLAGLLEKSETVDSTFLRAPANLARLAHQFIRTASGRGGLRGLDPVYTREFIAGTS